MAGLQKRLQRYFNLLNNGMDFSEEIKEVKREMSVLERERNKGVMLRSKEKELEEGEKCTQYFFKKILTKGGSMTKLNVGGKETKNTREIMQGVEEFYQNLFNQKITEETVTDEILNSLENKIEANSDILINEFNVLELSECFKSFKRGKSPGMDGLPLEFYEKFWDILVHEILINFKEFDQIENLPDSFKTGMVTLLYKKGQKTDLRNWRPISLLNFDYKLFSKILSKRMSLVLEDVIHPDQACAVPGRKITDSLVLIRDAICLARDRNMKLIALNLDFEKAFDRISHQYLFKVLQKMGFPERFLKWVGLLYGDITSRIIVNGKLSKAIKIRSGVRQGCPLSPLLYVACIEPLAQLLRRDKWIKGLDIPGTKGQTVTCVLYMDDMTILATDFLSVQRALKLTEFYGRASGAKLNRSKSEALLFGPWEKDREKELDVKIKKTELKILGIKFDHEGGGQNNWPEVLAKVKKKLGFWGLRSLTLEGKILIYKAVILNLFSLLCSVFTPPRYFLLGVERAVFYFFWGSKWEKLRRQVVKKRKENGGKGMPDLDLFLGSRFTALHIKYATSPKQNKTAAMSRFWMGFYLRAKKVLKIDSTTPVSFNMPKEYEFIKKFLKRHALEDQDVDVLTNHKALISLVQDRETVSRVPGLTLGESQQVWRNAAHPALQNRHKDLAWMVAHEILPVRAVMHSRGMAKNSICPRPGCEYPETVRHLLWECGAARNLWAVAAPLYRPHLPAGGAPMGYHLAILGVSQSLKERSEQNFTSLWPTLNVIKDTIWVTRNLLVGKRITVPPQKAKQMATSRLQGYRVLTSGRGGRGHANGIPAATVLGCP